MIKVTCKIAVLTLLALILSVTFNLEQLYNIPSQFRMTEGGISLAASVPSTNWTWVRTGGPPGGIGYDVRIDPSNPDIIYVTDAWAGIHKSADHGETWRPINEGITTRTGPSGDAIPIFCLTIDPSNSNILWTGTIEARGVYRSEDGGTHWELRANGISDFPSDHVPTFRSFAVDPHDSNTVFVALEIGNPATGKVYGQIYKTTDSGKHWRKVLQTGNLFRRIEINPKNPKILYAGSGIFDRRAERHEGIFKSTDGGETWTQINNGLTNLTAPYLAMDPENPDILYAATGGEPPFGGDFHGGVFKTTNGGQRWDRVLTAPDWPVFDSVAVSHSNPNVVYAAKEEAVFKSENQGQTWERLGFNALGNRMGIPIGLEVDPINPNIVYVNSYEGGVYRSDDGGHNWQPANQGYTGAQVSDVALDPQNPRRFYVAALLGVFKSLDGGNAYLGMNGNDNSFEVARSITTDPHDWQTVLTGNQWSGQVFRSNDGGKTWVKLGVLSHQIAGLRRLDVQIGITSIVIPPDDPKTIYVAMVTGRERDPRELKQYEGLGIFKSTDGGQSWQSISNGLPARQVFTLIMDPSNPQMLYAGTPVGVARTTDAGEHWEALKTGLPAQGVHALSINPQNPATLYAGLEGAGVFKTVDGGNHWQRASLGMDPQANIRAIAIHPTNPTWVFAADWNTGVYFSGNSGQRWARINQGLRTRAVNMLAMSGDGSVLYAGTEGEGIFRLELSSQGIPPTSPPLTDDRDGDGVTDQNDYCPDFPGSTETNGC